jgi:hypothetical protein
VIASTLQVWNRISRRPVDAVAIITAAATGLVIVVNALFLQSSPHNAPLLDPSKTNSKSDSLKPVAANNPARPIVASPLVQPVAARHGDAIAELIGPSPRIAVVQRVLSDYGYGQIKVSGVLDSATGAAIQKFEREHNLPSTGRVSDRMLKELAAMVGHPIE